MSTAAAQTLTVVSWGGPYGAAQKKHMIDPYVAATGVDVVFEDYAGSFAEVRAQVEADDVTWDVLDVEVIDLERACSEGLLAAIPHDVLPPGDDGVPAAQDFHAEALASECGVGVIFWSIIYAYDRETIRGGEPSTIADFFDVEAFPGKRALRKRPQVSLEWGLIADGVPRDAVYDVLATEAGQARAFAKLDSIRDHLVWYESWADAPRLLDDGGAVMVQSSNGRMYSAIHEHGRPFTMVWDANVFDLDVWAIVKGTKQYDQALDFVKFATRTGPLAGMQDVAYGPTRRSAEALIDPAIVQDLPTAHVGQGIKADGAFWARHGMSLGDRFDRWLQE